MPTFNFQCPKCKIIFDEFFQKLGTWELTYPSPCCSIMSKRIINPGSSPLILIKGNYKNDKRLDGGVPFGELPGDEDYEGIEEPGYRGPIP